jgi:hypothetical protein
MKAICIKYLLQACNTLSWQHNGREALFVEQDLQHGDFHSRCTLQIEFSDFLTMT